jgi:hypothetical protein
MKKEHKTLINDKVKREKQINSIIQFFLHTSEVQSNWIDSQHSTFEEKSE